MIESRPIPFVHFLSFVRDGGTAWNNQRCVQNQTMKMFIIILLILLKRIVFKVVFWQVLNEIIDYLFYFSGLLFHIPTLW